MGPGGFIGNLVGGGAGEGAIRGGWFGEVALVVLSGYPGFPPPLVWMVAVRVGLDGVAWKFGVVGGVVGAETKPFVGGYGA